MRLRVIGGLARAGRARRSWRALANRVHDPVADGPREPITAAAGFAVVSAVAGITANVLLIGFFTLAPPWLPGPNRFAWLGTANDVVVIVQFAALVPVVAALRHLLPTARRVRVATVAAMMGSVLVVVLQVLLVAGSVDFAVQGPLVTICLAVVFGWVLVVSRTDATPPAVARLGAGIAVAFGSGILVTGAALLLPTASAWQYLAFGLGAVPAMLGWLAFPVWALLLARRVLAPATRR